MMLPGIQNTSLIIFVVICLAVVTEQFAVATSLLTFPDWKNAEYIGGWNYNNSFYKFGPGGLLKANFQVPPTTDEELLSATVYIAVNGIAEVYVDGKRAGGSGVGRRVLEPALSQWERRMFYVELNVTELLHKNNDSLSKHHTLGIALGRGHWSHYQYGNVGAMVQLVVNGKSVLVTSSSSNIWYAHSGPILEDDLFNGEVFDGRIAYALEWNETFAGWASYNQNDTITAGWKHVANTSASFYRPPLLTSQDKSIPPTVTSVPSISKNITWFSEDTCVIDFGENGAGWTRLHVKNHIPTFKKNTTYSKIRVLEHKSSKGAQIFLAHGEMINLKTGDLFNQYPCPVPSRVCVNQTDHYISNGEGEEEVYEPRFTWHGYRYVKVKGCPSVIMPGGTVSRYNDVSYSNSGSSVSWACEMFAIRVRTNFSAVTSTTLSSRLTFPSSPILTSVATMIERTMLSNQIGYQTSCPQREKVAWTGDTLMTAPTLLLLFKEGIPYLRNYVRSLSDNFDLSFISDAPDGTIDDTVPHVQFQTNRNMADGSSTFPSHNGSSPGDNGGWTPVFPLTVKLLYETDGDAQFVKKYYARLKTFTKKMMEMCGNSVPPPPIRAGHSKCGFYGDWSNPLVRFATTRDTGRIISTSYTILQLDAMSEMAKAIGNEKDHLMYNTMASKQRARFDAFYWNETLMEYGTNHTFVQLNSIMAIRILYWNSPPQEMIINNTTGGNKEELFKANDTRKKMAKDALVKDIQSRGRRHTVGLIGWRYLFEVLSFIGETELAIDLLESRESPSLGFMLKKQGEGTTLWERWDEPSTNPNYISQENSTSLNHPMFGSVYAWLVGHKDEIDQILLRKRRREEEEKRGSGRKTK